MMFSLTIFLIDYLSQWLSFSMTIFLNDYLSHWLSFSLTIFLIDYLSQWLSFSLTVFLIDYLSHWLSFSLTSACQFINAFHWLIHYTIYISQQTFHWLKLAIDQSFSIIRTFHTVQSFIDKSFSLIAFSLTCACNWTELFNYLNISSVLSIRFKILLTRIRILPTLNT